MKRRQVLRLILIFHSKFLLNNSNVNDIQPVDLKLGKILNNFMLKTQKSASKTVCYQLTTMKGGQSKILLTDHKDSVSVISSDPLYTRFTTVPNCFV